MNDVANIKGILDLYDKLVEECASVSADYHGDSPLSYAIGELEVELEEMMAVVKVAAEKDNQEA